MRLPGRLLLPVGCQLLLRELADRLEHAKAGLTAGGLFLPQQALLYQRLQAIQGVQSAGLLKTFDGQGEFQVRATDGQDLGAEIFRTAKENGWVLTRLDQVSRSLEEVYLQLTEKK